MRRRACLGSLRRMPVPTDPADDMLPPLEPMPVAAGDRAHTMRQLALDGLTDAEIAARLGCPVSEVRASPAVLVPLGDAQLARVERALYESAVGGETWSQRLDKFGALHTLRERKPPDARAALEILARQRPDAWADSRKPAVQVVVQRIVGKPPSATLALDVTDAELVPDSDADRA